MSTTQGRSMAHSYLLGLEHIRIRLEISCSVFLCSLRANVTVGILCLKSWVLENRSDSLTQQMCPACCEISNQQRPSSLERRVWSCSAGREDLNSQ